MNEIYLIGNYIVINNTTNPFRSVDLLYKESSTEFLIYYGSEYNKELIQKIAFSDVANWQDQSAVVYTEESLRTFLQTNTGKADSGATSITESSVISPTTSSISTRPTDFSLEVSLGRRQGVYNVNKFGYNLDIDTGTEEIIASFGGAFDPMVDIMTTAQTFDISFGLSDGQSTTGALSLLIDYLDENFELQQGVHNLTASSPNITSFSGLGINRVVVISNGGDGFNNGDITFTASSDATIQAMVPANASVTQQCIYHTPINHTLLLDWFYFSPSGGSGGGPSGTELNIKIYSWSRVTLTRYDVGSSFLDTSNESSSTITPIDPFIIGGREVLYITATTNNNNSVLSGRFSATLHEV